LYEEKYEKMFTDKRAVTPVLSNLLLTVVAVAIMAIATTATYVITTNLKENMSERVIIEDLWVKNSEDIQIYIRNVGRVSVQISAVYVNDIPQPFSPSSTLEVGDHFWLNISVNDGASSGRLYYIDVVTSRGTHVGDHYKVP
jgi:hypothetical protein